MLYTRLMLAYGQHNLGLCGGGIPPNWAFVPVWGPSAQFRCLRPSFGPSAQFSNRQTHRQTHIP